MGAEWMTTSETIVEVHQTATLRSVTRDGGYSLTFGTTADTFVVVEGTLSELATFAQRVRDAVDAAAYWAQAPACEGFPDACGAPAGQPCEPGCPSLATDEGGER